MNLGRNPQPLSEGTLTINPRKGTNQYMAKLNRLQAIVRLENHSQLTDPYEEVINDLIAHGFPKKQATGLYWQWAYQKLKELQPSQVSINRFVIEVLQIDQTCDDSYISAALHSLVQDFTEPLDNDTPDMP